MTRLLLCGNGPSRKNLKLHYGEFIEKDWLIGGCNAFYRDFTPDILCACDPRMQKEIDKHMEHDIAAWGKIVYRIVDGPHKPHKSLYEKIYDSYFCMDPNMSSGPTLGWSVPLLYDNIKEIHLIGVDLSGGNIYRGTPNYDDISGLNVDREIADWVRVFKKWPQIDWHWHSLGSGLVMPGEWWGMCKEGGYVTPG